MKKLSINHTVNLSKSLFCLLIFLMVAFSGFSQNAGISPSGAVAPDASAGLDVNFSNKGLLIPRVALNGTTGFAPLTAHVAGMVIYNNATIGDVTPGFYFNNGTKWVSFLPKATANGEMQYWNGTTWVAIAPGTTGQRLQVNATGIPVWVP